MNKQAFSISIATYCGFNQNIQYLIFFFLLFIPCLTLLACLYFLVCLAWVDMLDALNRFDRVKVIT